MNYTGKKVVLVLGSTGMLGNAVCEILHKREDMLVTGSYRHLNIGNCVKSVNTRVYFDPLTARLDDRIPDETDYVINCIGTIKPFMNKNIADSIYINSLFPHKLANYCNEHNMKLIHITTDCVYSGLRGPYNESDVHDAQDDYGKSKSLGEPKNCMVIRTSIIGPEIHKNASFVEWVKTLHGREAKGFTNHLWNGITTKQYGRVCDAIIRENKYKTGTFHVNSPDHMSKYEMIEAIAERYGIRPILAKSEDTKAIDRRLLSLHNLGIQIPKIREQIREM